MIAPNLGRLSRRDIGSRATCVGTAADAGGSSRASTERGEIRVPGIGSPRRLGRPVRRADAAPPARGLRPDVPAAVIWWAGQVRTSGWPVCVSATASVASARPPISVG